MSLKLFSLVRCVAAFSVLFVCACPAGGPTGKTPPAKNPGGDDRAAAGPGRKAPLPPQSAEKAPSPSRRLAGEVAGADTLARGVQSYFSGQVGRRIYVQIDKPLYKPGETVWVRTWDLVARSLAPASAAGLHVELISPRGAVVAKKRVQQTDGMAQTDFELAEGIDGGEYTLRATSFDGQQGERPLIVSTYEAPRLKMKLEFVRKAYGAGDEVTATIEVKRATGEPLRNHPLSGLVRLDGQDLPRVALSTNANGEGLVRFVLPGQIATGDGLLTILADDGGLTESVAKRIPIIVRKLAFSLFPEGGQLVEGLPGRVYFEAKTPLGKPADVSGRIVDDHGAIVARFESVKDGLGRFDFTPGTGRSYHAEIEKPVGVSEHYALPLSVRDGCLLRSFDDLDGELSALRVAVRCSEPRKVLVVGMLRENLLDAAAVQVPQGEAAIVYLQPQAKPGEAGDSADRLARAQGVARITVFDDKLNPLAERLVYRNRRSRLQVQVEPHKKSYSPREQVTLAVTTRNSQGQAQPATLALSVVDDTVLTFADDKTGHMLSRLYLEPELPGKVEEPNFYFDLAEEKSGLAMDLLMGTRGYRRFEWMPGQLLARATSGGRTTTGRTMAKPADFANVATVPAEPVAKQPSRPGKLFAKAEVRKNAPQGEAPAEEKAKAQAPAKRPMAGFDADDMVAAEAPPKAAKKDAAPARPATTPPRAAAAAPVMAEQQAPAAAAPPPPPAAADKRAAKTELAQGDDEAKAVAAGPRAGAGMAAGVRDNVGAVAAGPRLRAPARAAQADALLGFDNEPMGWAERPRRMAVRPRPLRPAETWAVARVFPTPTAPVGYNGPRNDFRETVFWQPSVQTGQDGKATVSFALSDAVTSFRVLSEGTGGGAAGRDETVIKSSLPFSVAVKLPLEVSEGDRVMLPVVLSNEQNRPLRVDLQSDFGSLLTLEKQVARTSGAIGGGQRETLYFPLTVTGKRGQSDVRLTAETDGLRDELIRQVRVSPRGFPQHISRSGRMREGWNSDVLLAEAMPGTFDAQVRVYPSTLSTLVSSVEGLLRHPVGCFEQASSVSYPNVMILRFMKAEGVSDARLLGRASRLMDEGYKRLIGYETSTRGYEWFGSSPGHEALTAYGLMEFADMRPVYHELDKTMLSRTAEWLMSRRDGTGGYARDAKSLDSFGRASKQVTDAYITYALSEVKQAGLSAEIDVAAQVAQSSDDAYVLALTTATLFNSGRRGPALAGAKRLVALQDSDGGWSKADHSITRSGGENLHIETTSLSLLALVKAGSREFDAPVERGIEWLMGHRRGYGAWGTTQATVLSLKALTAYAQSQARERSGGEVTLLINGQAVGSRKYDGDDREALTFAGLGQHLLGGKNHLELKHSGRAPMPFSVAIDYRSLQPEDSRRANVEITTGLERTQVKLGESVRMRVVLRNKTDRGLPMTLGRVELPGGLTFQTWQLKELREKGLIAFYETGPRQVVLYLRDMKPKQQVELPLDLVAIAPGQYTAQASSAYLYYTDEHKTWAAGTQITVDP